MDYFLFEKVQRSTGTFFGIFSSVEDSMSTEFDPCLSFPKTKHYNDSNNNNNKKPEVCLCILFFFP